MRISNVLAIIGIASFAGLALFSSEAFSKATPVGYTLEAEFPSPGPSPQDITWDGANLWVVDDSTDVIYRLDPKDCAVLQTFPAPDGNTQGLTWHNGYLWACGADSLTVYQIDRNSGEILSTIPISSSMKGYHATGIAFVNDQLLCCFENGMGSEIVRVDLEKKMWELLWYIPFYPLGISYDGSYLWTCADILMPESPGYVVGWYHAEEKGKTAYWTIPAPYPTGVAFDGSRHWVTESSSKTVYKLKLNAEALGISDSNPVPFELLQNHPNPFNASTTIKYSTTKPGRVVLSIYTSSGQNIKTLVEKEQTPGSYNVTWDGTDAYGHNTSSGTYLYSLSLDGISIQRKLSFIK